MDRIKKLFQQQQSDILSVYFTAGYPYLNATEDIIIKLSAAGVDMIEIGVPFSDPMADGPTIQQSSDQALKNGMSVELLFAQLTNIRFYTQVPPILMGYLNPILQYGFAYFCRKAKAAGIDALIIPDLPLREYETTYKAMLERYELKLIFLVTPQTEPERIRLIDEMSDGFVYGVTSASVTGATTGLNEKPLQYLERLQQMNLRNPVLAGFGISNHKDFTAVCKYVNGAIIGSSFIRALKQEQDLNAAISTFIQSIRS